MSVMATHKRKLRHAAPDAMAPRSHDRAAAWLVLIGAGGTTMSFNIWHAIHGGMPFWLALLFGMAPVTLAMGLSHIDATNEGGWFMKAVTFTVMLGAMVLSIRATGYVVKPATGGLWWLFGAVIDAAALVALQVILSPESRAAARAARKTAAEAAEKATEEATQEAVPVPPGKPPESPPEEPVPVPPERPSEESRPRVLRLAETPEARRARAEYRKSVSQGQPLSDRALGAKFEKSRTWGASRIREVEEGPALTAQAQ